MTIGWPLCAYPCGIHQGSPAISSTPRVCAAQAAACSKRRLAHACACARRLALLLVDPNDGDDRDRIALPAEHRPWVHCLGQVHVRRYHRPSVNAEGQRVAVVLRDTAAVRAATQSNSRASQRHRSSTPLAAMSTSIMITDPTWARSQIAFPTTAPCMWPFIGSCVVKSLPDEG
eukprot:CAMPEP_0206173670 /NCGR_PEP_ID=MMETSP1474-20131121/49689_1 /ASSEMBLY_ACC=CAM_ASM_001110 /TAXON_ID=97495 /ORGANISM="Imantonia sp., Strain RCC918" /LENGTH=173 /DNA_ID=CAMNT_0053582691 /DNA_START=16 /DNA_END=531 /DNA_ORIENTATION=+